jgi:dimethylargininase
MKIMSTKSFSFTHAITRQPSFYVVSGLRSTERGEPDFELMKGHHLDYVNALKQADAEVIELDPLEDFPDSVFVEDTALCLPEGAILMRPGAPSRLNEVKHMAPYLRKLYKNVHEIKGPGTIEAGDILTTEKEILIGRSNRTNLEGISEITAILEQWNYKVTEVLTPPDILHFKTDCSLLDSNTILSTERLAATGCFDSYKVILTYPGEEEAANTIRYNNLVLAPEGFPKTTRRLLESGFNVVEIGNTECAKIDGGMSCLSLRFTPKK